MSWGTLGNCSFCAQRWNPIAHKMEKINDSLVMMDFMNKSVYIILNSQLFRNIDFQPVFQTCQTRGGHHVAVLNVAG